MPWRVACASGANHSLYSTTMSVRVPQLDLAAILEEPNPHIDLKTSTYETSTRNFLKALTIYKNRSINTISERRKAQAAEKKKLSDKIQQVEKETNQCKLREIELVAGTMRGIGGLE